MENLQTQFHCGGHDFGVEIDGEAHKSYSEYLECELEDLDAEVTSWIKQNIGKCPECGKYRRDIKANKALDNLSAMVKKRITRDPREWTVFISNLAKEYRDKKNAESPLPPKKTKKIKS